MLRFYQFQVRTHRGGKRRSRGINMLCAEQRRNAKHEMKDWREAKTTKTTKL